MIKILITGTFWRQLKVTDENKAILSINGLKLDNKSVVEFGGFWLCVGRGHELTGLTGQTLNGPSQYHHESCKT